MKKIISLEKQEFDPITEAKKTFIHYKTRDPLIILEKLGYTCYNSHIDGYINKFDLLVDFENKQVHITYGASEKFKVFCLTHALGRIIYRNSYNTNLEVYPFNIKLVDNYGLDNDEKNSLLLCNEFATLFLIDKDCFLKKYNPLKKYDVKEKDIIDFLSKHFEINSGLIKTLKKRYVGD